MTALEKNILSTLGWFDIYNYPLTQTEVWQYLWQQEKITAVTLSEVISSLHDLEHQKKIRQQNGFWQLYNSADLLNSRQAKYINSIKKRQIASRGAKIISHLPFIEMVALGNTLAFDNASVESDIDLLIVAKPHRLFTARFIVTAVIHFLGLRRHGQKINNRLCLSFYLTSDNLNFRALAYDYDPYLVYWLATLNIMFDKSDYYQKFLKENSWLDNYLVNWRALKIQESQLLATPILHNQNPLLLLVEYILKKFQLIKIHSHKKTRLGDGTKAVLVNDQIMKFHESDARPQLAEKFISKTNSVL